MPVTKSILPVTTNVLRHALAGVAIAGTMGLSGLTLGLAPAQAAPVHLSATSTTAPTDGDPVEGDGNNDSGKWGLAGLTGLFGYKKYRDLRATPRNGRDTGTTGSTRA